MLFYAGPHFSGATHLKLRFADHQKQTITASSYRRIDAVLKRLPGNGRKVLDRLFQLVEHSTKAHSTALEVIEEIAPDVVVVSPMVHFFTPELEYVKAAKAAGIPSVLAVASWDNLTNKGKMKVMPDVVAVWNDAMARKLAAFTGCRRTASS